MLGRTTLVAVVLVAACGDTAVTPDPTGSGGHAQTTTGTGASDTTATGAGGQGAANEGGDGQGGRGDGGSSSMMGGWYESGSRLKAQTYVGTDGSRTPAPFMFDTMQNTSCWFQRAEDGQRRCVPNTLVSAGQYFADPSCTQPLGVINASPGCPQPTHAIQSVTSTCFLEPHYRVFSVGAQVSPATVYAGAACTATSPPAGYAYYQLTALPAAAFVAATSEVEP